MLLNNSKDDIEDQNIADYDTLTPDMLDLKEFEDWVILQPKKLTEENVDNGFVKFDYND